jgi:UDP-glucose 4-epimerase
MKIWITGARGFIGQYLSRYIHSLDHEVAGLGHGMLEDKDLESLGIDKWLNGDVSLANLDVLLQHCGKPDAIFHLAGGSSVGPSLAMPQEDLRRSVSSASDLLEWVRLRSPKTSIVMASSAAVYGAGHEAPIEETTSSKPYSPYGYHKKMAELLMESYANNFGLKISIVRLFSVYGPGLRKQLLWDACSRLSSGVTDIEFGGTGKELRDWIHVEDAVAILWKSLESASQECFIVNGGTGVATTVQEITKVLCKEWNVGIVEPSFSGSSRSGDPKSLIAATSRLKEINIKLSHEWPKGVSDYVAWFKEQQL